MYFSIYRKGDNSIYYTNSVTKYPGYDQASWNLNFWFGRFMLVITMVTKFKYESNDQTYICIRPEVEFTMQSKDSYKELKDMASSLGEPQKLKDIKNGRD